MKSRSVVSLAIAGAGLAVLAPVAMGQEPVQAPPDRMADGVTIEGVPVAGLTVQEARAEVLRRIVAPRRRPVVLQFGGRRFKIEPVRVGYRANVDYAVRAAFTFGHTRPVRAEMDVPLPERVNRKRLRNLLRAKARRVEIPAVDAAISFRGARPVIRKARVGSSVRLGRAQKIVENAILNRTRTLYRLPAQRVRPDRTSHPAAILIERDRFRLTLFKAGRRQSFTVAVGQPAYPTPRGSFNIVTKQRNPTWFPPNSPWAAGIGPVPPGPGNPLGTRWMGTSATAIGIHGTYAPSSLGTRASHGCIRMSIANSEWLYDQVEVGTKVVIV